MVRLLLLFMSSLAIIYAVNACSCKYFPLQYLFCQSQFVIKIKVEDVAEMKYIDEKIYKVNVLETYKGTEETKAALKLNLVMTRGSGGLCGLTLHRDQVVVVGGYINEGQPRISYCNLLIRNLTQIEAEENNLRENFAKSCSTGSIY